jgi:hypothetical protein
MPATEMSYFRGAISLPLPLESPASLEMHIVPALYVTPIKKAKIKTGPSFYFSVFL